MIRKAEIKDISEILELLIQVNNVHEKLRPDLFIKDKTKYNAIELENVIKNENKPIFVFINDDNKLCGYAFCLINNIEGTNIKSHKTIYIDDICVDENHRHERVGTSLYEYVLDYAKQIGCYNITLNVWDGNDSAIKFYKNCGLKTQKTVMEKILV